MHSYKNHKKVCSAVALALLPTWAFAQQVSVLAGTDTGALPNFENAAPMPLRMSPVAPGSLLDAGGVKTGKTPVLVKGQQGTGQTAAQVLFQYRQGLSSGSTPGTQAYGVTEHPYSTSRVDIIGGSGGGAESNKYPYRAAGKLFFDDSLGNSYVCSGSLIKKGVVVTAAHCVTEFGGPGYRNFVFVPAYYQGIAPFGAWRHQSVHVVTTYKQGTDSCVVPGIVCENDVALIELKPQGTTKGTDGKTSTTVATYPGTATGWFSYGYDGYGFTPSQGLAQFTQLGYPVALDGGQLMQRTDSMAFIDDTSSYNSVWGSLQSGGSSGGPELVNFGVQPALASGTYGGDPAMNTVVGVTSWGYIDQSYQQQGAAPFTSGNIQALLTALCTAAQSAGRNPCD